MSRKPIGAMVAAVLGAIVVLGARSASAQATISHPGDHPKYAFEAEPHLALDPYGHGGIGPGFRGTVVLVDNGFVSSINNSIGIGFGLDWVFYGHPCNDNRCPEQTDAIVPLVLQWNFWLHRQWSVFGEPGIAFHFHSGTDHHFDVDPFAFFAGGRFHFNDSIALTLRLGAPFFHYAPFSVGVSFLL